MRNSCCASSAGPGLASLGPPPPCPPASSPGQAERLGRGHLGSRRGSGAAWGEGLPGVGGRRRRAGKACWPRVPAEGGGRKTLLGRRQADAPALGRWARRGSRSFPHTLRGNIVGSVKSLVVSGAAWRPPPFYRPLPRRASGFHSRGSALAALPVAGWSPQLLPVPRTLIPHPLFFLPFTFSVGLLCPLPAPASPFPTLSYPFLASLSFHTHAFYIPLLFFFFLPTLPSISPSFSTHCPLFRLSRHLTPFGFYASPLSRLWGLPFIACLPFHVLI